MGVISHQPSVFTNLKILKFSTVHPVRVYMEVQAQEKVSTSTEIKNHQLDSSPSSIFKVVSCEEIRVLKDIASAKKLIAELRVWLKQCKILEQSNTERLLMTKLQDIDGQLAELPASKRPAMQVTFCMIRYAD
ncbi:hypothetical protein L2E82_50714 [Cichorium intybus]|nr:hypothetical protein L2E82_50714 [Cichorium intybus]